MSQPGLVVDDVGLATTDVTIPPGVQPGAQEIWLVAPRPPSSPA